MSRMPDVERFKDEDGVVDLEAMKRSAERRVWTRIDAVSTIVAAVGILAVAVVAVSGGIEPVPGVQAALIFLAIAWVSGCRWAEGALPDASQSRRASRLLPYATLPCLLAAVLGVLL